MKYVTKRHKSKAGNTNIRVLLKTRMVKSWRWSNKSKTQSSSRRNKWRWSTPSR